MPGLIDLTLVIVEMLDSWRVYVGIASSVIVIWFVITVVSNETARWLICVPLGILGVGFGFYWQARSDSK